MTASTPSSERGVALPMALMSLALLSSLLLALASLARIEPVIAANHLRSTQARALAESGIEYAIWALSNPAHPAGLPTPLPPGAAAPAPFDGVSFMALGPGGFSVTVTGDAGGDPQRVRVTATGWVPSNKPTAGGPTARRRVTVELAAVPDLGARAPCVLCVRGPLTVAGAVAIDGRSGDPACGDGERYGVLTRDAATVDAVATVAGSGGAVGEHRPDATFEPVRLSPAALEALRTLAWRQGTYYGPGFPGGGTVSDGSRTWSGRIVFDAARPLPHGVVFVDTTDGGDVTAGPERLTALAAARLEVGAFGPDPVFRGWIVVNGSLEVAAPLSLRGLVYAVDALAWRAPGAGRLDGLAISHNVSGGPTVLEATGGDGPSLRFDCEHAAARGLVAHGFAPIPGTWREVDD
jgi:hypothetical protein